MHSRTRSRDAGRCHDGYVPRPSSYAWADFSEAEAGLIEVPYGSFGRQFHKR